MTKHMRLAISLIGMLLCASAAMGEALHFHALVFYSTTVERDHVQFAHDALNFLSRIALKDQFQVDTTSNWDEMNEANLRKYQLVIWLNESPTKPEQRLAFQQYMEHGGAWLGFHAAGYNDKDTGWPWFVEFLGGAVFSINSWPPLPAKLVIDERGSPVTANLPDSYVAPSNEWYLWKPNPRLNADVRVLVTLDPANYPLGWKDVVLAGDCPVVWTNTKYKMVYMNMGHGGKILTNATQNQLIENAVLWLGTGAARTGKEEPVGIRVSPQAVAVNPKTKKVYAVNSDEGTVTVVSGANLPGANQSGTNRAAKKIKVGRRPSTIGINLATDRIYVANSEDGTVSVVDGSADRVVATVKVGELPYVVAVNSASDKIYVSKTFSDTTTVIDGATNQARILNTGVQATAMISSAELNKSYMINMNDTVTVLDGANDASSKIHAGSRDWGLALNPATNKIYVGDSEGSTLSIIDARSGSVHSVQVGEMPGAIAVDAGSNRIYVANYGSNSVTVLDGANDAVVATIPVEVRPQALAADPATHGIYVANTGSHSVSVISGESNSVIGTVQLESGPYAIVAANGLAYVECLGHDGLFAIDPRTMAVMAVASVGNAQ
ncbi:MAG: ThuA domain-containing protein [Candidatus Acidiferrum sp.]